ncbi:hypothetical protein LCGC14_0923560 [marine sediment metagenome]|uniref:Uncharacterized protein n=1 Tax=marine sediment metagenome TaxID=412755 RepID=A0A0F9NUU3_9ZZZZ
MKRITAALKINDVHMFTERFKEVSSETVVMDTPKLEGIASLSTSPFHTELASVQDVGKYQAAYFQNADLLMVRGIEPESYKRVDEVYDVATLGKLMEVFERLGPATKVANEISEGLPGTLTYEAYRTEGLKTGVVNDRPMAYFQDADILMLGEKDRE